MTTAYYTGEDGNNNTENAMQEVYNALGWQGGTIHQVLREIARLKDIEKAARSFGDEVAFADQIGQISKRNKGVAIKGAALRDALQVKTY